MFRGFKANPPFLYCPVSLQREPRTSNERLFIRHKKYAASHSAAAKRLSIVLREGFA